MCFCLGGWFWVGAGVFVGRPSMACLISWHSWSPKSMRFFFERVINETRRFASSFVRSTFLRKYLLINVSSNRANSTPCPIPLFSISPYNFPVSLVSPFQSLNFSLSQKNAESCNRFCSKFSVFLANLPQTRSICDFTFFKVSCKGLEVCKRGDSRLWSKCFMFSFKFVMFVG